MPTVTAGTLSYTLTFNDTELMRPLNAMALLGNQGPHIMRRALNHEGRKVRTQVVRDLTMQTGLQRKVINRAVKQRAANFADLSYELRSRGGNVSLKYFKARETRKGVTAAPWGSRRLFAGTFIKGGLFAGQRFGNYVAASTRRVDLDLGGHVYKRLGEDRHPIEKQKAGLFIPKEMVSGVTVARFQSIGVAGLQRRVEHEVMAVINGYAR